MNAPTELRAAIAATPAPDLAAIKLRQQATWASGDYATIGTTLQIVGETLAEAAARELMEEVGVLASPIGLCGARDIIARDEDFVEAFRGAQRADAGETGGEVFPGGGLLRAVAGAGGRPSSM